MKKYFVIIAMAIFIGACQNSDHPADESIEDEMAGEEQTNERQENATEDQSNDTADESTNESSNDDQYVANKMADLTFYGNRI